MDYLIYRRGGRYIMWLLSRQKHPNLKVLVQLLSIIIYDPNPITADP